MTRVIILILKGEFDSLLQMKQAVVKSQILGTGDLKSLSPIHGKMRTFLVTCITQDLLGMEVKENHFQITLLYSKFPKMR